MESEIKLIDILHWVWNWLADSGMTLLSTLIIGIIASFIANYIYNHKKDQLIERANEEILSTIKLMIAQNNIPNIYIINSLIQFVTKKYSINPENLYNKKEFVDILIGEIMENVFLDINIKQKYCDQITEWYNKNKKNININDIVKANTQMAKKSIYVSAFATMIPIITASILHNLGEIEETPFKIIYISSTIPLFLLTKILMQRIFYNIKKRKLESENKTNEDQITP